MRASRDDRPAHGMGHAVDELLAADGFQPRLPAGWGRRGRRRAVREVNITDHAPRTPPTSASSRPPAWPCSPAPTTSATTTRSPTPRIVLQAVEVAAALIVGLPALVNEGTVLEGRAPAHDAPAARRSQGSGPLPKTETAAIGMGAAKPSGPPNRKLATRAIRDQSRRYRSNHDGSPGFYPAALRRRNRCHRSGAAMSERRLSPSSGAGKASRYTASRRPLEIALVLAMSDPDGRKARRRRGSRRSIEPPSSR